MTDYFTDRMRGPRPRTNELIGEGPWAGFITLITSRIADGSFGKHFPDMCPDGMGPTGTSEKDFNQMLRAHVPDMEVPLRATSLELPSTETMLDALEFCYQKLAEPIRGSYHSYYSHVHLEFREEEPGQEADVKRSFRTEVNQIFSRNGIAYDMDSSGRVQRVVDPVIGDALQTAVFKTGDEELDGLLERARYKFLDPRPQERSESLEKLWDAWERLKTIEDGTDKKESATRLLARAAPDKALRQIVELEARQLTDMGNSFHIRHSEKDQIKLVDTQQVDYFFHRMFAFIWFLLRATWRGASS